MTARVSVVVPTRDRADLLPRLLQALEEQECRPLEVIVVDDASTDETPDLLGRWRGEGRVALRLDSPAGSYAARNAGWRAARGDIIAFTDDDCIPDRGWIAGLERAMSGGAAAAQGRTLAGPGRPTPFTHQIEQLRPGPPYRTCNIAYRRDVLEELGGFDQSFRWYADNILGLRVRQTEEIAWAPDALVHHPPRPRQWRSRSDWLARFDADARHRAILRDLGAESVSAPAGALPILLWVVRPLVKQSLAHLRYFVRRPRTYIREAGPMLTEKRELLAALRIRSRAGEKPPSTLPALPAHPAVTVVVVTRDRPRCLRKALAAIEAQTWQDRSIVVVNNGRGPLDVPEGVEVVDAQGMRLGEARQHGLDAVRTPIVAFTDDDCLPEPHWLEQIAAAFERNPNLRGVQGRTIAERGPIGSHAVRVDGPNRLYQTCNMAYRTEALDEAGGFDTAFDGWFEDTALAARVLEGGPIDFVPGAVVTHMAMPRRFYDRATWRRVIADERRLAGRYPRFYRRTRGPAVTANILLRWLAGSFIKTAIAQRPRARADVLPYLQLLAGLLRERWALLGALLGGA